MDRDTDRASRHDTPEPTSCPPGLLEFHPMGRPPGMRFYPLDPGSPFDIGRAETCQATLRDVKVSRRHARLEHVDDGWMVVDCGSTNGIVVNGRRLSAARLVGGEVVRIGQTLFRFLAQGP